MYTATNAINLLVRAKSLSLAKGVLASIPTYAMQTMVVPISVYGDGATHSNFYLRYHRRWERWLPNGYPLIDDVRSREVALAGFTSVLSMTSGMELELGRDLISYCLNVGSQEWLRLMLRIPWVGDGVPRGFSIYVHHVRLLTNVERARHRFTVQMGCNSCGCPVEAIDHVLWKCCLAIVVWTDLVLSGLLIDWEEGCRRIELELNSLQAVGLLRGSGVSCIA
ncbi:hypothetical protein PVK06_044185 [Gossypium arboreum]|uniref:Reverse transcriptase zinc-binding domain-containing protein n=1 Tax=Gossypium arboreum TaxID=29729 RepID=A0ABR0MQH1_GOSAR|nr:hypothetical protein PVK06_044185 [Gossypium arboreum]